MKEGKMINSETNKKDKSRSQIAKTVWVTVLLIALVLTPILVPKIISWTKTQQSKTSSSSSLINQATDDRNNTQFVDRSVSDVVEKISPSVVSITTSTSMRTFFGNTESSGAGTGVIMTANGFVLTNKHVVDSANEVVAITSAGEIYENVKIVFKDPLNDLAILKIEAESAEFTPIEIGDSKTIKVGQPVLAIGNSLGQYQNTVTRGIISGVGRSITAQSQTGEFESLTDMIQTDAAINSGNSGGPLVNAGGQLIGINTAVAQDANNMGFAIPIGAAKGLLKQLGSSDEIQKAVLGVRFMSITPSTAKEQNLPEKQGALVVDEPTQGTAAYEIGVKKDDIILQVNNYTVGKDGGLNTLISEYMPGDEISLKIRRGDSIINLTAPLKFAVD